MTMRPISTPVHLAEGEISRSLERAMASIGSAAEHDVDVSVLSEARGPMQEVHGALRMLEIQGGERLIAECLALLDRLEQVDSESREQSLDSLIYGLLLLGRYVERAGRQKRELPDVLLPTLNTLRGLRRAPLLPAYHFSSFEGVDPGLAALPGQQGKVAGGEELQGLLRRLRQMLQIGLLGLIRDAGSVVHAKHVHRAFQRLGVELGDSTAGRWLRLAAQLMGTVVDGGLPVDASLRLLVSRLDLYLRGLAREGDAGLATPPPRDVMNGLLYFTAIAAESSEALGEIRDSLGLTRQMTPPSLIEHEREALSAPGQDVLCAVSSAILEDLDRLKDTIETLGRLGSVTDHERQDICEQLARLGSTLGLVGLSDPASRLKREHTRLQSLDANAAPERVLALLEEMADALTEAEEAARGLDDVIPSGRRPDRKSRRLRAAEYQAITEALSDMERVRRALEFLNGDIEEGEEIQTVDAPMSEVVGTLRLIGHVRVADLIERARLRMRGLPEDISGSSWLSSLADALAALEWHLEGLLKGLDIGEETLDLADEYLTELENGGQARAAVAETTNED